LAEVVKLWIGFLLALASCAECNSCVPASTPDAGPLPVSADRVDAATAYQELVEAGCLDPTDDAGLAAVVAARQDPNAPSWVACVFNGGTPQQCGACPTGEP